MSSTAIFDSAIVEKNRLLPGIHGLRGVAALAVVLHHIWWLVDIAPPVFFEFIHRDFGYSVHLFFILSAFSLCYSTQSKTDHPQWLSKYFIKRFFRIAPLFYFMIALQITRQLLSHGKVTTELDQILFNLTFAFGLVPFQSMVWAGWSVGVEMIFYVIFPILLLTIRTRQSALILLFFSILISYLTRSALHAQHMSAAVQTKWNWAYFSFGSNLCFFAMGMCAYHASRLCKASDFTNKVIMVLSLTIIGALLFLNVGQYLKGPGRWDIVLWGFGLMGLCIWQKNTPGILVANKFFGYLGERSFSIYLLHPVIIFYAKTYLVEIYSATQPYIGSYAFFVCAILLTAVILAFAELTYKLIELPGIRLGQRIAKAREPGIRSDLTIHGANT